MDVSLGVNHTVVITKDGRVYTAGNGSEGQLGGLLSEGDENVFVNKICDSDSTFDDTSMLHNSFGNNTLFEYFCCLFEVV